MENGKDTLDRDKFQEAVPYDRAEEIHFTVNAPEGAEKLADISQAENGNIYAYQDKENTNKYYIVNTSGEKIYFPKDSNHLFSHSVAAILCLDGGYGSARILDKLDYDMIRTHVKSFIGFSDTTALHIALEVKLSHFTDP